LLGISERTYFNWCRIDDEDELFITAPRVGGHDKKTTAEDDEALRDAALTNNFAQMSQLRQLPEIAGNANIVAISDRTLRRRLREQGINNYLHYILINIFILRSQTLCGSY
jgi:hypothetical protein